MKNMYFTRQIFFLLGLLPCIAYGANVSIQGLGNLSNSYTFPAVTLMNYTGEDQVQANPLSFIVDDYSTDIELSLTANHSDASSTWMTDDTGHNEKIYYEVIYTTCYNGSVNATVNLSKNTATDGITCGANHTCTILNQFGNPLTCFAGGGGEGHLTIKRMGLTQMPESANYSGTLQLTASVP